jgi:hypothetical protein
MSAADMDARLRPIFQTSLKVGNSPKKGAISYKNKNQGALLVHAKLRRSATPRTSPTHIQMHPREESFGDESVTQSVKHETFSRSNAAVRPEYIWAK